MSEKPSPSDMVRRMLQAAAEADSIDDLPVPGTFAREYGDAVRDDLNAENVEAFVNGTAIVNLLVQEAILRVSTIAQATESETPLEAAYVEGCKDGAMLITQIMAQNIEGLIHSMIEGPAIQRAFNQIIANF